MKYLVIGAGGIGGSIAAYLATGGKDTTLVARGQHLEVIQNNGLKAHTQRLGDLHITNIKALSPEDDFEKTDVIFVCVKGYSLIDTVPIIKKAAHDKTIVIPILNSLNAGEKLGEALSEQKGVCVLGGCVYTSAFISAPGEITQPAALFRIVYGERDGFSADGGILKQIADDLNDCSIDTVVSDNIERDVFKKFTFISAFAATDSYFDVSIGKIQQPGEEREMFISLLKELKNLADAKGLETGIDLVDGTVKMMEGFEPGITSSMHKDLAAGKSIEKQELVFDVVEAANGLGVLVPEYTKVAKHFGFVEN